MSKKFITFVVLSSLIIGGIGGWIFTRFIVPKINTIPFLVKYNLTPSSAPLVINRREEIHINEGSDTVAAIQSVRPWMVAVVTGDPAHPQIAAAGLVMTSDGIIVLTKSAVGSSGSVKVLLSDGRVLAATVVAQDPGSELVLVKVDASNLAVSDLGFARDLQLGQRMVVLQPTLSDSHYIAEVSYLSSEVANNSDRVLSSDLRTQTFKIDGQQIAFEGAVAFSTDAKVQGVYSKGQIITADTIRSAWENYSKNGSIKRNYFGFYYQPVSKIFAVEQKTSSGDLVRRPSSGAAAVIPGSPAQQAGLQEGDLITSINDNAINLDNSFEDLAARFNPGDKINVRILRNGQEQNLTLTVTTK